MPEIFGFTSRNEVIQGFKDATLFLFFIYLFFLYFVLFCFCCCCCCLFVCLLILPLLLSPFPHLLSLVLSLLLLLLLLLDNDNNNRIQRRYSRIFTISSQRRELSPTRTLKWPVRNHVKITCNTTSAFHVQVSCYVPLGTKGQLSY